MSDKIKILVCTESHCKKRGAEDIVCALKEQRACMGLKDDVSIKKSDCLGMCEKGPSVYVKGLKLRYKHVDPGDCKDILRSVCGKKQGELKSPNFYVPD
ncbi:MAG: (2Fe-2S) ferredoxin domain-containing protein [Candidatus Obscuribacterales bacterium]|nr:(2Fe-2S) ferredoxin domain-containing protein [Candidatus Obscuribacterales bacterium]